MKKSFKQSFLLLTIIALTLCVKISEIPVWFIEHYGIIFAVYIVCWLIYCVLDSSNDER